MALQVNELVTDQEWEEFLINELRIPKDTAQTYAASLANEGHCRESITHLLTFSTPGQPSPLLTQLGIKVGHCLKLAAHFTPVASQISTSTTSSHNVKLKIPRPVITLDATQTDFDQFCFEWKSYRSHYQLTEHDIASHLFYCGNEDVRKRIRIEKPSFIASTQHSEGELLQFLKDIVLSKTSKIVHIKQFRDIRQSTTESSDEFLSKLQLKASCCSFLCNFCGEEIAKDRIKEQFILGLSNTTIQTAILKTESVNPGTSLDKLLAEAMSMTLEQSMKDQQTLKVEKSVDSLYSFDNEPVPKPDSEDQVKALSKQGYHRRNNKGNTVSCSGCGKANHRSNEREQKCPAWGKKCFKCGLMNHFSSVCRSQRSSSSTNSNQKHSNHLLELTCMAAGQPTPSSKSNYIPARARLSAHKEESLAYKELSVFPDTGANICLMGPTQIRQLNIKARDMEPCSVRIATVGGNYIESKRKCKVDISLGNRTTTQVTYFAKTADRFFLSRQACKCLKIISASFPYPEDFVLSKEVSHADAVGSDRKVPPKPSSVPFEATVDNIPKLENFLIQAFSDSAFNRSEPFPKLSTPPAHIHLKPDHIIPKPAYWPATIAEHWAEEVRLSIERDVASGILIKVPFNEPTVWCARMVVVRKQDGRPRRTVDYQQLNSQCLREPNHGESPFHTARRIPQNMWKSTFDAVDGYHSVELDEESSKLTTFITPWGRYRYLRFPQGHCSAGDAFNGRVQQIVAHVPRLVRIVDDMCIFDETIEGAFWHAWELLSVCANNGIVVNLSKFNFCRKTVDFAGLSVTSDGIEPSQKMLAAIKNFPAPKDISNARAFFWSCESSAVGLRQW